MKKPILPGEVYGNLYGNLKEEMGDIEICTQKAAAIDHFNQALANQQYEQLTGLASNPPRFLHAFRCLQSVLSVDGVPEEIVNQLTLITFNFYDGLEKNADQLYFVLPWYWKKRKREQAKKIYQLILGSPFEMKKWRERLIDDFAKQADWDQNPNDFNLYAMDYSMENDWRLDGYANRKIAAMPFESEAAFIHWQLKQPENIFDFELSKRVNMDPLARIRRHNKNLLSLISRLRELGEDTTQYQALELYIKLITMAHGNIPSEKQLASM